MLRRIHKILRIFFIALIGVALVHHFFIEKTVSYSISDDRLHMLLSLQRKIDVYAPLSTSHIQGTHNSYNSDAYHLLFRYHDRQQRLTLLQQLKSGARFIELDTHWTFSAHTFKQDFLLCHGSSKLSFLPFHWGCSPFDLSLKDGLLEISEWMQEDKNKDEVLILYIEDHTEARHEELYQLLNETGLLEKIYPSGGCIAIPDELTKAHVLNAGKQIIFWKDELRLGSKNIPCGENEAIANLAYNDLGNLKRKAEDRTFMGSIDKRLRHGKWPRIHPYDVQEHLLNEVNILNLDNFEPNDGRLYFLLWSWNLDTDLEKHDSCAVMKEGGTWILHDCSSLHPVACTNATFTHWQVSEASVAFEQADEICQRLSLDESFHFSAPTNISENQQLFQTMEETKYKNLWINIRYENNDMKVGDKRAYRDK